MTVQNLLKEHLKSAKAASNTEGFQFLNGLRVRAGIAEKKLLDLNCDIQKYLASGGESILSYSDKYSTEAIVSSLLVDIDLDMKNIDVLAWCQYCIHLTFPPYYKLTDDDRVVRWYKRGRRPADLHDNDAEEVCLFSFSDELKAPESSSLPNLLMVERKLFNALNDIDSDRVLKSIIDMLPLETTKEFLLVLKHYEKVNSVCITNH